RKQIFTVHYDDAQWLTGLVENLLSITKISGRQRKTAPF
ncbi:hypothetical protein OBE_01349, partial [human gut metagenome]